MIPPAYTEAAADAIEQAARAEHDFAGWLASVLCRVAARLGSTEVLLAGRPGSWEAADVRHLVEGTVGADGELLSSYAEREVQR